MSSNVTPNDSQGGNLMVSNGHLMTIWIPDCHKIAKLEKSRFWGSSFLDESIVITTLFYVAEVGAGNPASAIPSNTGGPHLLGGGIPTLDPGVHILPVFQILYGPYDPYITHITNIIWTVRSI